MVLSFALRHHLGDSILFNYKLNLGQVKIRMSLGDEILSLVEVVHIDVCKGGLAFHVAYVLRLNLLYYLSQLSRKLLYLLICHLKSSFLSGQLLPAHLFLTFLFLQVDFKLLLLSLRNLELSLSGVPSNFDLF